MKRARIVYQDWIVRLGRDPDSAPHLPVEATGCRNEVEVEDAVTHALASLSDDEREFVARFHFMGETYQTISEKSGRVQHKLEAIHKRALRKLRRALRGFVARKYGVGDEELAPKSDNCCPVCSSAYRDEIDELIAQKQDAETWRPILRQMRETFGISIRSPQALIGHQKYHRR